MIYEVHLTKNATKDLRALPAHILSKLKMWIDAVNKTGLENVRKNHGYHDEPLKGPRDGQRSIRLSRSYRAIYVVEQGNVTFVSIEEVNKHEY